MRRPSEEAAWCRRRVPVRERLPSLTTQRSAWNCRLQLDRLADHDLSPTFDPNGRIDGIGKKAWRCPIHGYGSLWDERAARRTFRVMARYSGGPITHRALKGPRATQASGEEVWKREILYTLDCIQQIRSQLDNNELATVRQARQAGFSWTEIATRLNVSRESALGRWQEIDPGLGIAGN